MPSPLAHNINAQLHKDAISPIVHAFFWTLVFQLLTPFAVLGLWTRAIVQLVFMKRGGDNEYAPSSSDNKKEQLAVFITGCDSGFGKETAIWAATAGYVVFAGCLFQESFDHFKHGPGTILPIQIDVTNNDSVAAAFRIVENLINDTSGNQKRVFHALINNAGIGRQGLVDWLDLADFQKVMDGKLARVFEMYFWSYMC
jgi:hypothetical protein